jgi:PASTA domain
MRRVEGWMSDLANRLPQRWGKVFGKLRARREKLAKGFWADWDRFTGPVGDRWGRLTERTRVRDASLSAHWAQRGRRNVALRVWIALGASLCVVLVVTMAVLFRPRTAPAALPNAVSVTPSLAARGIDIPDVRGMPASDARARLERAGLKFAGARAAFGPPGQVLRTEPSIGRSVPSATPVTIVVGAEAKRIGSATQP